MERHISGNSQRGVATVEFAITAGVFFLLIVAIVSGAYLFWIHNALVEATRRGARYAASQCSPIETNCPGYATSLDRIQKVVVYGTYTPGVGATPFVPGLTQAMVTVTHSADFGVAAGTVSVKIQGYNGKFALSSRGIPMPPYDTTLAGENAGFIPGGPSPCP